MSGYVANAAQLNHEPTNDVQKFKKEFQTVGRPPVTDHNNDQYMHEHSASSLVEHRDGGGAECQPCQKEGAYDDEEQKEQGVTGEETLGCRQPFEQIDAEEASVHPNNPVQ